MIETIQGEENPSGRSLVAEKGSGSVEKPPADMISSSLEKEPPLPLPDASLRSATENERIVDINKERAGINSGDRDGRPFIKPELRLYSEGGRGMVYPDKEVAERIKIVKDGLLPQDREGRVTTVGGVCREALEELEAAAGDPNEWTIEDLKREEVKDLLRFSQGFQDLLHNRTMHGPQTRAIQRIVRRQQDIEAKKLLEQGSHSKQHENVEVIAKAIEHGIGQEESPYSPLLKDTMNWVEADSYRNPEDYASWLTMFKNILNKQMMLGLVK